MQYNGVVGDLVVVSGSERSAPFELMRVAEVSPDGWVTAMQSLASGQQIARAAGAGCFRAVLDGSRLDEARRIVTAATDYEQLQRDLKPLRDENFYSTKSWATR